MKIQCRTTKSGKTIWNLRGADMKDLWNLEILLRQGSRQPVKFEMSGFKYSAPTEPQGVHCNA